MKTSTLTTCLALTGFAFAFPRPGPEPETFVSEPRSLVERGCTSIWQCSVADANTIADALIAGGTNEITVTGWADIYNLDNRCALLGHAVNANSAASYSRDVGYGLRNIINSCSGNGKVGGDGAAGGNGYFAISLVGGAS